MWNKPDKLKSVIASGLAIPARFERATYRLGICCSILLSYGTV